MALTEEEFTDRADEALEKLDAAFSRLAARLPLEADLESGVLKISFSEPDDSVFVISPNSPARQIWVSALLQSFKFDWLPDEEKWSLAGKGEPLEDVLQRLTREQLGDDSIAL